VVEEMGRDCMRVGGFEGDGPERRPRVAEGYGRDFVGVLSWSGSG
jgi:hypothetical protein